MLGKEKTNAGYTFCVTVHVYAEERLDDRVLTLHSKDYGIVGKEIIALEKNLIRTMVQIREEKGLTQVQLAQICDVKQPVIARIESSAHSPQVDSLLRILVPLGYTLQIVPIKN